MHIPGTLRPQPDGSWLPWPLRKVRIVGDTHLERRNRSEVDERRTTAGLPNGKRRQIDHRRRISFGVETALRE